MKASLSAGNAASPWVKITGTGNFLISINGEWTGTIYLQTSTDGENLDEGNVDSFTSNIRAPAFDPEKGIYYRLYGSISVGTATVKLVNEIQ
jgi:hypothetical protein